MKFLILFIVAMLISSIGFKKFVWFISLGYGFSIAGLGIALIAMFAKDSNLTTLDVSIFDTSKVQNMAEMFAGCSSLTTLDLRNFDTRSLIDDDNDYYGMQDIFDNCTSLTRIKLPKSMGSVEMTLPTVSEGYHYALTSDAKTAITTVTNAMQGKTIELYNESGESQAPQNPTPSEPSTGVVATTVGILAGVVVVITLAVVLMTTNKKNKKSKRVVVLKQDNLNDNDKK